MTPDELAAVVPSLPGDFKALEPQFRALDKHLTLRTYLDGYALSPVDTQVWTALRSNKAAIGIVRKGPHANLTRWFTFVEKQHPEISDTIKTAELAKSAKKSAADKAGGSYNISLQEAEKGVVTRFLPEPSGYLHIGHAKAALLCDYFAHRLYDGGKLRLRLDDTNPAKEKEEFQDAIVEDLALMGIKADSLTYTSDYFDHLYETCKTMISEGNAYADDTDVETMQKERMDGIASKRRDTPVEDNLAIFEQMKAGSAAVQGYCIRAKLSYENPNKALRDPVIYRCNITDAHHRTGTKWKMYPTYDFACPVVDSHEGITHALRATEYTDRNPQYQWFLKTLKLRKVYLWDFSRLNFVKTFLSKRKLAQLVETGKVWGWDDPRMPTIRGVRRRGMTIPALRDFILRQGPSRNISLQDWKTIWATNTKEIDPVAPRHTAVLKKDMVKVVLTGAEAPVEAFVEDKPKHPKNPAIGTRKVAFSSSIYMDQADAVSFKDGEEITLMSWGNAFVRKLDSVRSTGSLTCELNLQGDFKKTEKKVSWLSAEGSNLVPAELWEFDYLITKDKLEKEDDLASCLNPVTETMEEALCEEGVGLLKRDDIIQLERKGYYRCDKGLADWTDEEAGEKGRRVVLFSIPTGKTT